MFPSLKLGRLFGIPVYLHSTLLLLPLWVLYSQSGSGWPTTVFMLAAVTVLFGCVLLHEFGHALMARWFGVRTRDVTLYPIGGVARLERMAERPVEEIFIALAGPAVNVVIAALLTPLVFLFAFLVGPSATALGVSLDEPPLVWAAKFCFFLWASNIVLVLFNLLPAFPMDGGRVFRAILAHFFGLVRGTEIAVPVGIAVVFLFAFMMIFGPVALSLATKGETGPVNLMPLLIAGFISLVGPMELRALRYREQQKREAARRQQAAAPTPGRPYTPLPYPDEDEAHQAPQPAPAPELRPGFTGLTWDREFGVWVRWQNGRRVAVYWNGPE
jgi:Zn-dependent protease